jgi:hypothetical protein
MSITTVRPERSGIFGLALSAVALCIAMHGAAHGQLTPRLDPETAGRRYIVAFPDTTRQSQNNAQSKIRDEFDLFIYSDVDSNRVTIGQGGGGGTTILLRRGVVQVVPIEGNQVVDLSNTVRRNTISVDADFPVVVYCYMATRFGMEAWTPIPVEMWGTEYNVAAIAGGTVSDVGIKGMTALSSRVKAAPSEVLVIAAYDNTKVRVRASAGQRLASASSPVDVVLNAGECYQVQSDVDTTGEGEQIDLGGASVAADKPVGVISGNTRTLVRQDQSGLLMNIYKGMLMEWLPSVEQEGTEFVYMPSWDSHRPGIGARAERAGEYVRAYGSGRSIPSYGSVDGSAPLEYSIPNDTLSELALPATGAARFRSRKRMQAFMHSPSILELLARIDCFSNYPPCQLYAGWAPYMVEMTPREEWPSFAPYYAPASPGGMEHNINVVTDTANARSVLTEDGKPFPFTRRIPGTDLVWGSQMVVPGQTHFLMGTNGARFYGYLYGALAGREHYSPGRTRKGDDPEIAGGGGEGGDVPMGGALYEEENALSYAYPLAPRRSVIAPPDSFEVVTGHDCSALLLNVRAVSRNVSGIRSIALDPAASRNAKLVMVDPLLPSSVLGRTSADLKIVPVNPTMPVTARLAITDRTGHVTSITHDYAPPVVETSARAVDFGTIPTGAARDTVITFTNGNDRELSVNDVRLAGSDGFTIVSTDPEGPAASPARAITLARGGRLSVRLRASMRGASGFHADSLKVGFGCLPVRVPLFASAAAPAIAINDLDFGTFVAGVAPRTMELKVCNIGASLMAFAGDGDPAVTWKGNGFSIPPSEIATLKGRSLAVGECATLHVTFNPDGLAGVHRAVAYFSLDGIRDSSVWQAVVSGIAGTDRDARAGYSLSGASPNPTTGMTSITYALGRPGHVTLEIRDLFGGVVATLVDGTMGAGEHRAEWDARGTAAGLYYCRVVAGEWSAVRPVMIVR